MRIEVVQAFAGSFKAVVLELPARATVREAISASGLSGSACGIFGKRVTLDTLLSDGDRVEIYRPLAVDPKEARRRRALKAKKR